MIMMTVMQRDSNTSGHADDATRSQLANTRFGTWQVAKEEAQGKTLLCIDPILFDSIK